MRAKTLLHEMQAYLRTELELADSPQATQKAALMKQVEMDRPRLLREVDFEVRHEDPLAGILFRRVLVAVDASPQAMEAVDLAVRVTGCSPATKVALVHVLENPTELYDGFAAPVSIVGERCLRRERGSILLRSAAERFVPAGRAMDEIPMPEITEWVREGPVVDQIVGAAQEFDADLIIIGTHARRGISHFLMGSTAEGVIRRASCPVLSVCGKREG